MTRICYQALLLRVVTALLLVYYLVGENDPELQLTSSIHVGVTLLSNLLAFCLGESSNNIFWMEPFHFY